MHGGYKRRAAVERLAQQGDGEINLDAFGVILGELGFQFLAAVLFCVDFGYDLFEFGEVEVVDVLFEPIARAGTLDADLVHLVAEDIDDGARKRLCFGICVEFFAQVFSCDGSQLVYDTFLFCSLGGFYTVGFELGSTLAFAEGNVFACCHNCDSLCSAW